MAQAQWFGLSPWLPLNATGSGVCPGDTYRVRANYGAGPAFHWSMYDYSPCGDDYPFAWHRARLAEFARIRPLATGSYYPLTRGGHDPEDARALSFVALDRARGVVIGYRREACPFETARFRLKGLDPDTRYAVEYADAGAGESGTCTGRELMEQGLRVTFAGPRSSAVVFLDATRRG